MHASPPLFLHLRPSPRLAILLLLVHALAAAAVGLAGLPFGVTALLWILLPFSAFHLIRHHALLRASGSPLRLQTREDGSVEYQTREGKWLRLHLLPQSTLFPFLAVLCLRPAQGGRNRALTIFSDALSPEDWRRLRVWLRWQAPSLFQADRTTGL